MTAPFQIEAMGPQHREAWLRFFDHEAFADNPRWAGCYCQYPSTDHAAVVWKEQTAELNRERACQRIASGRQRGLVALAQGRVVGWCHAGPWTEATIKDDSQPEPLATQLAAMHTGPLALYERAGFAKLREVDGRWVMRKPLAP